VEPRSVKRPWLGIGIVEHERDELVDRTVLLNNGTALDEQGYWVEVTALPTHYVNRQTARLLHWQAARFVGSVEVSPEELQRDESRWRCYRDLSQRQRPASCSHVRADPR
jgi:hypothetical protein